MLARKRKWKNDAQRVAAMRARRDTGTPELAMHKAQAVRDGDPALSTCPLDILLAHKRIEPQQHEAAWIYAKLHRLVFGPSHPRAAAYEMVGRGSLVSQYIENLETEQRRLETFRRADFILKRDERWARKLLRDMVLDGAEITSAYSVGILRTGLDMLAREFGLVFRGQNR